MKKRIFLLVLALCLSLCLFPVLASAATVSKGTCGDDLTWKLSDTGTLTISGEGEMYDYKDMDAPWKWLKVKRVKVKDGVTSIGDYAFDLMTDVTSITLADSVTTIGKYAFSNCSIKKIDLPANVKTIEESAFVTTKLTSIKLPSKLKTIGARAFCGSPLKTITIPASVTTIGNEQGSPFSGIETLTKIDVSSKNKYYCDVDGVLFNKDKTELIQYPLAKSGTTYKIPSSVDKIGDDAFRGVTLKKITIPKGVKEIGMSAFHYAHKLTEVEIPSTVKKIGSGAFDVCYKVKKFTVSEDSKYFSAKSGVLFNKDKTELIQYPVAKTTREYSVPGTVEYIHGGAFSQNENLFSITFPKSLKEMGGWIVEGCENLQSLIFKGDAPQTEYPSYAFSWDGNLVFYPYNNKTWTKEVVEEFEEENSLYAYDPKMETPEVTASNNNTSGLIKLKWDDVKGAKSYYIFRATSKYGDYGMIDSTTKTSYTDKADVLFSGGKIQPGKKYYYQVVAVKEDAWSLYSEPVGRTCNLPRVEVTAKNTASSGKVKLSWKAVDGAEEYTVYRSTKKDGTYKAIKTTENTYFTDSTGKVGKRYYYKVEAVHKNTSGNSAKSVAVARTRDLARPDVEEKLVSGVPKLSWDKISGAKKYEVYRATSKDGTYKKIKTTSSTSHKIGPVKEDAIYYYKVKAIHENTKANSAYSKVVDF